MWWLTAVKAILGKPFNLYGIQGTTNPASPVLIVNGPIAREIGLNARGNLFGPGFPGQRDHRPRDPADH